MYAGRNNMGLFIVTDAGVPEPGAIAVAQLHAVVAEDFTDAFNQVGAALGRDQVLLVGIDATDISAKVYTRTYTTTLTDPPEGPPE